MEIRVRKGKYNFCVKGNPIPPEMITILNSMFEPDDFVDLEGWDWNNAIVSEQKNEYKAISSNQRLREVRLSARMTQQQLAEKLGTNAQYISNLENGIKPIGRKMAIKLGVLFSIDPSEFLKAQE